MFGPPRAGPGCSRPYPERGIATFWAGEYFPRWRSAPASDLSSVETTGSALPCSGDMSFLQYQGGTHVDVLHLQVRCAARAVPPRSCLLLARRRLRRSAPLTAGPLPPCSERWQKTERREKGEDCNVCCTCLAVVLFVWLLECACAWQVYDPSVKCCVLSGVLRLQWQAGGAQKGGARPPSRACRSALRRATSDCTPGSITHVHARPPQNPSCSPGWCCSCASRTPNGCPWSCGAALRCTSCYIPCSKHGPPCNPQPISAVSILFQYERPMLQGALLRRHATPPARVHVIPAAPRHHAALPGARTPAPLWGGRPSCHSGCWEGVQARHD